MFISQAAGQFHTNLQDYYTLGDLHAEALQLSVETLQRAVENYRDTIYQQALPHNFYEQHQREHLIHILRQEKVPLNLALRLIEALSSDEMQLDHPIKRTVAKAALVVWELVVFKCRAEKQPIFLETRNKIKANLEKILTTLPEREVETRFYTECLLALTMKLQPGEGKVKEVAKKNAKPLINGSITLICSASPAGANPSALIGAIIDLVSDIYDEMEANWYQDIWAMSWISSGKRITTQKQFRELMGFIEGYDKEPEKAFYVAQMYFEIISNDQADLELKKAVFKGKPVQQDEATLEVPTNLLALAQMPDETGVPNPLTKGKAWRVRYIAAHYLKELVIRKKFRRRTMQVLVDRYATGESHPIVKEFLLYAFASFVTDQENKAHVRKSLENINLNEKIEEVSGQIRGLPKKIAQEKKAKHQEPLKEELRQLSQRVKDLQELKEIKEMPLQSQMGSEEEQIKDLIVRGILGITCESISSADEKKREQWVKKLQENPKLIDEMIERAKGKEEEKRKQLEATSQLEMVQEDGLIAVSQAIDEQISDPREC